jgi:hypothetical protein
MLLATLEDALFAFSADQTHRADNEHQNHSQHHCIFGNVLTIIARPSIL